MALATQCPHCHTTFRVAADQLKLRGGIVRCGACHEVFDGNASLIDLDGPPKPPVLDDVIEAEEPPVYALDFGSTFGRLGILPEPVEVETRPADEEPQDDVVQDSAPQPEPEPEPEAPAGIEAEPVITDDEADARALEEAARAAEARRALEKLIEPDFFSQTFRAPPVILPAPAEVAQAVPEPAPEPIPEPTPEPVAEPVPEPVAEPAPEPVPEAVAEEFPEPAPESAALDSALLDAPNEIHADLPGQTDDIVIEAPPEPPIEALSDIVVIEDVPEVRPEPAPAAPAATEELHTTTISSEEKRILHAPPVDIEHGPLPLLRQATGSDDTPPEPEPAPSAKPRPSKTRSAKPRPAAPRAQPVEPPPAPEPVAPEPDEPEFLRQAREQERSGHRRRVALVAGSLALTALLVLQGVSTFRNVLVARFPALGMSIARACDTLGCRIELPAQIEALAIETGELQTLSSTTFALVTLLRNQSTLTQSWPYIELELTDATDKALVRRVFSPGEYLSPGTQATKGFAGHSEQPVRLYFELKQVKASGYHIAVFYP